MIKGILLGVSLVFVAVGDAKKCGIPSHLWCSSRKTAEDCHVTEQCEARDWRHEKAAPAINLVLYYEALCPFCKMFITEQLFPTFNKLQIEILNVSVLPFGNAKMTKQGNEWVFTCQHGDNECAGNIMATCAINSVSSNVTAYLPFLNCMEENASRDTKWEDVLNQCAPKFKMSVSKINACIKGKHGNTLEHQMGVATKKEGVIYVPWIVINGQHTQKLQEAAQRDLLQLVCQTYTGPKPAACTSVLDHSIKNVSFPSPKKAKFGKKH